MAGYLVQGVRGSGKSLVAVGRALDHLRRGLPVATNMDLQVEGDPTLTGRLYRVPDQPTAQDLHALGIVHDTGDESKDGLLVLDECGTFLNSREWNGKGRAGITEWLVQSRKFGWSLLFIAQSANMLDKQLRETLFDYRVTCRRLDRIKIPFIGSIGRLVTFGLWNGHFPRVHFGVVSYGSGIGAQYTETWKYTGKELFKRYRTGQIFRPECGYGVHAVYTPVHRVEVEEVQRLKPKLPQVAALSVWPRDMAWNRARELAMY